MANQLQYLQEIKVGEGCSRCGGPLTLMAKDGKVFSVCFHCTSKVLVNRYSNFVKRSVKKEKR